MIIHAPAAGSLGLRVLVVDGNPAQIVVPYYLAKRGYESFFSTSGEEALNALMEGGFLPNEMPHVALIDYHLNHDGINGAETIRRMRQIERAKDVWPVLHTHEDIPEKEWRRIGAKAHLIKGNDNLLLNFLTCRRMELFGYDTARIDAEEYVPAIQGGG